MTEVEARERVAPLQSGDAAQEVVGRVEVPQRRGDALQPLDRVVGEVQAGERDVCACEACAEKRKGKVRVCASDKSAEKLTVSPAV